MRRLTEKQVDRVARDAAKRVVLQRFYQFQLTARSHMSGRQLLKLVRSDIADVIRIVTPKEDR